MNNTSNHESTAVSDKETDHEDTAIQTWSESGCGCKIRNGGPCSTGFTAEYLRKIRQECMEFSRKELDLILLGQIAACLDNTETTSTRSEHKAETRSKAYTQFIHRSQRICANTFRFVHAVGKKRVANLVKHYKMQGLTTRTHGNEKRMPRNTLPFETTDNMVKYLRNYAEKEALPLPGRVPGFKHSDLLLLPSSTKKKSVWKQYSEAAVASGAQAMAYSTFCQLWKKIVPYICIMRPMTDLCWVCQQNSTAIARSTNFPEREKSTILQKAIEHVEIAQKERKCYRDTCEECQASVRSHFRSNDVFTPPKPHASIEPNTTPVKAHYSFDMAQQVHYPSDPLQPGPMYFLTPRKCTIFGVCCEAIPRQIFYLTDEAADTGKGANCIISRLHHFFATHSLGEKHAFLHADNCVGQNKNNAMLHYLAWRVLAGLHTSICLSFLPVGHTKFSPDWCFGLFKQRYRKTKIGRLLDIAEVVDNSAKCNVPQLVAEQDGSLLVQTHDWTKHLSPHFNRIKNIKGFGHFSFASEHPGKVFIRQYSDSTPHEVQLLKDGWMPTHQNIPEEVKPTGLSAERQQYLFEKIREFCPTSVQDEVCPKPTLLVNRKRSSATLPTTPSKQT